MVWCPGELSSTETGLLGLGLDPGRNCSGENWLYKLYIDNLGTNGSRCLFPKPFE